MSKGWAVDCLVIGREQRLTEELCERTDKSGGTLRTASSIVGLQHGRELNRPNTGPRLQAIHGIS